MAYKSVFTRYELKYLLDEEQKKTVLSAMDPYMKIDQYGRTTIRNVYLDTPNFRLIRRSIEKPAYKEKIRIRSYSKVENDAEVFVELKKKYDGVVYKRRVALPESVAMKWTLGEIDRPDDSQISREIEYFMSYYGSLSPSVFLSYEREAYYEREGGDLRITFDDNILARRTDISLQSDAYGSEILPKGKVLMEIKCSGAIPLWMVEVLSKEKIYKTPFSKYGTAYQNIIFKKTTLNNLHIKETV